MARRSQEIRGVFCYTARDIKPDAIVIEVTNNGVGCSCIPINWATIYICKDIMDIAHTCRKVLLDLFTYDVIDRDSWVSNWENHNGEELSNVRSLSANRLLRVLTNKTKIFALNSCYREKIIESRSRVVVESFNCFDVIDDVRIMQDWVKQREVQNWLFRFLDPDDQEEYKSRRVLPDKLLIPGHEKLIAKAVNEINRTTPWT